MTEFFYLDFVAVIRNGELRIWWWDPGIHPSNGLLQMRLMTDRVEVVIGLHCCGDVVRGVVEFFLYGEVVFPSRYPGSSIVVHWQILTSLRCLS
jgi:hypothetical protein